MTVHSDSESAGGRGPDANLHRRSAQPQVIRASPRALVYLTVDWSAPERRARRAFREAIERLSANHPALDIAFDSLDEEDETVRDFLTPLGFPMKYPRGSGSLIWLESGRIAALEIHGCLLDAAGIVERTLALWGDRYRP